MKPQLAAGALVWQRTAEGPSVLLVERTKHRDFSLPKGKLDKGETLPECAVREIAEETGIDVTLGAPLGHSEYRLPGGQDKIVYYWLAEATADAVQASSFSPNDEVLALHWMSLDEARAACTYEHDVALIDVFAERIAANETETMAIVALRHAKAKESVDSAADADRRLSSKGKKQADRIAGGVAAFGIDRIISSTSIRCVETVVPVAKQTGLSPRLSLAITQDDFAEHAGEILKTVKKAIKKTRSTVFCSHLPVIPAIISAVVSLTGAQETAASHRASMLHTADFSIMHICVSNGRLVAVETHGAPA